MMALPSDAQIEHWLRNFKIVDIQKSAVFDQMVVVAEKNNVRYLITCAKEGITIHSGMSLIFPNCPEFDFMHVMGLGAAVAPDGDALVIGLGGGDLCRMLKHMRPKRNVTAIEIDKTIASLAKKYFSVTCKVLNQDAREPLPPSTYALVFADAYSNNTDSLTMQGEFWANVKNSLLPEGVVAINWAVMPDRRQLRSILKHWNKTCFMQHLKTKDDNIIQFCGANYNDIVASVRVYGKHRSDPIGLTEIVAKSEIYELEQYLIYRRELLKTIKA